MEICRDGTTDLKDLNCEATPHERRSDVKLEQNELKVIRMLVVWIPYLLLLHHRAKVDSGYTLLLTCS